MHRRALLALAASSLASLTFCPAYADEYRVTGPIVHENLAIYLVHGKSAAGPVPLTLEEALAKRAVKVHETGNVNELQIENLGTGEVFVQSGDIVKGGQQDRVLSISLVLPPKSGRINIASFCVEQGRWTARGREDVKTFATAASSIPSREAKIAMRAPVPATEPTSTAQINPLSSLSPRRTTAYTGEDTGQRQQEVWRRVRRVQDSLSDNVGARVQALASETSLQLALENEKLKDAQAAYLKALKSSGEEDDDIVGYVFAVNGKLNSAEVYPSNGLFRKMWPKLLQASVTEAISHKKADNDAPPAGDVALAFLDDAAKGKATERPLPAEVRLEVRDADKAFYFETRRASGAFVHRSYLAK
ncbi:MAG: DUF6569 family protein [Alphaproteobacteria bacterium]